MCCGGGDLFNKLPVSGEVVWVVGGVAVVGSTTCFFLASLSCWRRLARWAAVSGAALLVVDAWRETPKALPLPFPCPPGEAEELPVGSPYHFLASYLSRINSALSLMLLGFTNPLGSFDS